jgi:hypothetical protein
MTQSDKRPLRSREERAMAAGSGPEPGPLDPPEGPEPVASPAPEMEELRRLARSQGLSLSRERRAKRVRPDSEMGYVRMACRVSLPVRRALETARWELGLTFSEVIEQGVVLYLESRGLRVDGVHPMPPPDG